MSLLSSFLHHRTASTSLAGPEKNSMNTDPLPSFSHLRIRPSKQNKTEDYDCFGNTQEYKSRPNSVSENESEGEESDATLEDIDFFGKIGHPLERIPRLGTQYQEGLGLIRGFSDGEPEFGHSVIYYPGAACSCCCSRSQSPSSVTSSLTDYQSIVGDLLNVPDNPFDLLDPQNFVTYDPIPSASNLLSLTSGPPLMIKRVARDSLELSLLNTLNSSELRQDPWNPSPHVLQVVDHDPRSDHVYLCMERLNEYNDPPMSTVAQYIDFFRQTLEGLSFLHEHGFVELACSDPSTYMVDLSSGPNHYSYTFEGSTISATENGLAHTGLPNHRPQTPLKTNCDAHHRNQSPHGSRFDHQYQPHQPQPQQTPLTDTTAQVFDRSTYPVRYYFVNFSNVKRLREDGSLYQPDRTSQTSPSRSTSSLHSSPSSSPNISHSPSSHTSSCFKHLTTSKPACAYKQDVQDLGNTLNSMLNDLPSVVAIKFKALIKAMTTGGFGAEDSRKLFEALCKSLEACVFELEVKTGAGVGSRIVGVELGTNGVHDEEECESTCLTGSSDQRAGIKKDSEIEPEKVALLV